MTSLRPLVRHALLLAAGLLLTAAANRPVEAAPPLADPTRPAGLAASGATPARAGIAAAPPVWPQLQSVQVSAQGGSSALVDGRIVRIGERIGDAAVIAIDADGILLRGARYEQRIALSPGVAKSASATAPPGSRTAVSLATKENQ